jgi:hypothetical protein
MHSTAEDLRNNHRSVRLLTFFDYRDPRTPYGQAAAVQSMNELRPRPAGGETADSSDAL